MRKQSIISVKDRETFELNLNTNLNQGWVLVPGSIHIDASRNLYFAVIEQEVEFPEHRKVCVEEDCSAYAIDRSNYCMKHQLATKGE